MPRPPLNIFVKDDVTAGMAAAVAAAELSSESSSSSQSSGGGGIVSDSAPDYVAYLSEDTYDKMWLETQILLHRPPPKVRRCGQCGHRQWAKGAHPHRPLVALRGLVNGQRVLHAAAAARLLKMPHGPHAPPPLDGRGSRAARGASAGSGSQRYVLRFVRGHTLAVDDISMDDVLRSYLAGLISSITLICSPLTRRKHG
jgi:hypothetical protein